MTQNILQQKLDTLAAFPDIRADGVSKFGEILERLDDWDLMRINPLRFAEEHGFSPLEMVDLFVHAGFSPLQSATEELITAANQQPGLVGVFTAFRSNTPQIYADVDRTKAKKLNVSLSNIFDTLQIYLGSLYVFGVIPLVLAEGAGAEMRHALGTAVFSGMLGVTFFGLFLTPIFYVVIRGLLERKSEKPIRYNLEEDKL
jgi:multidrug efflux pump subunit AcrB